MKTLGELLDVARTLASPVSGLAADSRKVAPGDAFFALAGAKDDGLKHVADARRARRARHRRRAAAGGAGRGRCSSKSPTRGSRSPAPPRASIPSARDDRRRHRHQRQDLGRRLRAPDLGAASAWRPPRSAPSASSRGRCTVYGSLTTPDPITLHQTLARLAEAGVTHLAMEASSHGLDQKRLDGVTPGRRRLHQPVARPHGLSRDRGRISRRQAAPVPRIAAAGRAGRDRRRQRRSPPRVIEAVRAAGRAPFTVGAHGEAIRLRRGARAKASPPGLQLAARRRGLRRAAAAARRFPGLQRARRGGALHRLRLARRRRCSPRWRRWKARPAGWSGSATSTARRCSSITPTSPTRWRRRSPRCVRSSPAGSSSCSAAAATAIPASGR